MESGYVVPVGFKFLNSSNLPALASQMLAWITGECHHTHPVRSWLEELGWPSI